MLFIFECVPRLIICFSGLMDGDAKIIYAKVMRDGDALTEEAFSFLFPDSVPLTPITRSKSLAAPCKLVAYNTARWGIIKVPLTKARSSLKSQIPQALDGGREGYTIILR